MSFQTPLLEERQSYAFCSHAGVTPLQEGCWQPQGFSVEATPRVIENKVVPGKGQREKAKNWQMEDSFSVPFINTTN